MFTPGLQDKFISCGCGESHFPSHRSPNLTCPPSSPQIPTLDFLGSFYKYLIFVGRRDFHREWRHTHKKNNNWRLTHETVLLSSAQVNKWCFFPSDASSQNLNTADSSQLQTGGPNQHWGEGRATCKYRISVFENTICLLCLQRMWGVSQKLKQWHSRNNKQNATSGF